jgi:hypothetical protein
MIVDEFEPSATKRRRGKSHGYIYSPPAPAVYRTPANDRRRARAAEPHLGGPHQHQCGLADETANRRSSASRSSSKAVVRSVRIGAGRRQSASRLHRRLFDRRHQRCAGRRQRAGGARLREARHGQPILRLVNQMSLHLANSGSTKVLSPDHRVDAVVRERALLHT